ncbi:MAG: phytanoyl-CoA dioxygenase, partial [Actinomycetota bacterium]
MTIREALSSLGVTETTLTPDERRRLDEEGYLELPGLLSAEAVTNLNHCLARLVHEEGDRAGLEVHQEAGALRLSDLVNKDPLFDVVFTHPRVLAAAAHVL